MHTGGMRGARAARGVLRWACVGLLALAGCAGGGPPAEGGDGGAAQRGGAGPQADAPDAGPELGAACTAEQARQLLATTCGGAGGCHTASAPAQGLDLASPGVEQRLWNVPSRCNKRPLLAEDSSFLLDKLDPEVDCGAPMPPGVELSDAQLECLYDFVFALQARGPP